MSDDVPHTMAQLQSLVGEDGQLRVGLHEVAVPEPAAGEVLVRVQATPINPSDLGLLFAVADLSTVRTDGSAEHPAVTATIPSGLMKAMAGRVGQALPVGNEGAGVVVAAGSSPDAQQLLGRTVAMLGGAMYAEYRCAPLANCLPLPDGTAARDGASCFVNPLTALGMVETMRREGHTALVHTAAASNLGQMLQKICLSDGVSLVNIVRRAEQAELLRSIGAQHVCNSSEATFAQDLLAALRATGATIAFDATGGGRLAGQILAGMEAAAVADAAGGYSRYGSTVHKQVYIYGGLDRGPTEFNRNFGMVWSIGGWLLTNFLNQVGPAVAQQLRQRVVDELHTTFASTYTKEISLRQALEPAEIAVYSKQATGEKYLINPSRHD